MTQIVAINSNEGLFAFLKMYISTIGRYKSNVGPFTLMRAEEMNVRIHFDKFCDGIPFGGSWSF